MRRYDGFRPFRPRLNFPRDIFEVDKIKTMQLHIFQSVVRVDDNLAILSTISQDFKG